MSQPVIRSTKIQTRTLCAYLKLTLLLLKRALKGFCF